MPPKILQTEFIAKAVEKYENLYDYSEFIYSGTVNKGKIICLLHGPFWVLPLIHLNGRGCLACKKDILIQKALLEASNAHKNKFDYSKFEYKNKLIPSIIICPFHGEFKQSISHHIISKYGCCPGCSPVSRRTTADFIAEAKLIHGDKYDYSKSVFKGFEKKIKIICKIHKSFWQMAGSHLRGYECSKCGQGKRTKKEFIVEARKIHGYIYDYSKFKYVNGATKGIIICKKHKSFWQTPSNHLFGSGCPSCSHNFSKSEASWLNSLNIPNSKKCRQVRIKIQNKTVVVDGFDKKTNTIYEFYGDLWHGNPKIFNENDINTKTKTSYGYLFNKTIDRENLIKQAGYKLITIWESDWKLKNKKGNNAQ